MIEILRAVEKRLSDYSNSRISREIGEHDGMFVRGVGGAEEHYFSVGRSAIELIAQAMIATRQTKFQKVLDLPSGGGRVTRHLVKFFPDSEIFVSELDQRNEGFAAAAFGAKPIISSPDFTNTHGQTFDLIFVGSLVTHLREDKFKTAVKWFIDALAPNGVLVLTTSGRRADYCERNINHYIDPKLWEGVTEGLRTNGIGYIETERNDAGSFGFTLASPSWVARLVEQDESVRISMVQESAWDNHQDVIVIQKRPLNG